MILLAVDLEIPIPKLEKLLFLLKRFVIQKHELSKIPIGIIILQRATTSWTLPFSTDTNILLGSIDRLMGLIGTHKFEGEPWQAGSLLNILNEICPNNDDDQDENNLEKHLQVLLFFGRSDCCPIFPDSLDSFLSKPITIDTLYIHDKNDERNSVLEIFKALSVLECSRSRTFELVKNYKRMMLAMTELLGHPLVRLNGTPNCHSWMLD
jgi:hypothetical protein